MFRKKVFPFHPEGVISMRIQPIKVVFLAAALSLMPVGASASEDAVSESPVAGTGDSLSSADALAKAGDLAGAIGILEKLLAQNPGNTDVQLLYARTLSWKGEYEKALEVYGELIKREPQNAEAHAGYARVLSWKGEYGGSVDSYRRSLEIAPEAIDVRTGLARTLWWHGDTEEGLKELSRVLSKEPGNREALGLERRLRMDRGPHARASYSNSIDSDESRLEVYTAAFSDTFGLKGHRFDFSYKLFDASLPGKSANASAFEVRDSVRLWKKAALTPRVGLVWLDSAMNDTVFMTEGLSLSAPVAKGTDVTAAYNYYPLLDTASLIENNIRVGEAHAGVTHDMRRATLSASAAFADYSDGNSRYDLTGNAAVNIMDEPKVIAGFVSEYRDFSEHKTSGYFNPPHILSNSLYADVSGHIWRRLSGRAKATLGIQSFEGKSDYTTSFLASLEWAATRDLWLDAGYKYSRSALESAQGFRFEEFRAGVNYLF